MTWSPPYSGNSPIVAYVVQHKPAGDKWSMSSNTSVTGTESAAQVRGLSPVREYEARVFAVNHLGRSEASDAVKWWSEEEAPGGPPLHIKAVALSSQSMRVTWRPPKAELTFGRVTGYYVGYRQTGSAESFVYKTLLTDSDKRGTEEEEHVTLTGLRRDTAYEVTVQAYNGKGTGPASEVLQVQTLQSDPPAAPVLAISAVTSSSIVLTWSQSEQDNVQGYVLHQRKQADGEEWEQLRLPGDRRSHSRDRLACGTKYQFFLSAFNSIGRSEPASEVLSVKTEGTAPVAPDRDSLIHATNATTATLALDAWHDGACPLSSFALSVRPHKSQSSPRLVRLLGGERSHTLTDLLPATQYDLRLTAANEAGSTVAQYSFQTHSLIPHVPHPPHSRSDTVSFSPPLVIDVSLLLPATVSLVAVLLLVLTAKICIMRKTGRSRHSANFYGVLFVVCCSLFAVGDRL